MPHRIVRQQAHHAQCASGKNLRNSSVELLRIIAMLMIIGHHYVMHCGVDTNQFAFGPKLYVYFLCQSLGKIGVMVFFTISSWYLCMERQPTMRKALKRCWILEREVLFYSIALLAAFSILTKQRPTATAIMHACFPTCYDTWWYVTNYVIFLLLCPALTRGLRAIGKGMHASLCAVLLVGWGFIGGMFPNDLLESNASKFVLFLFIYVLVSFYRWYLDNWSATTAWILIAIGSTLIAGSIAVLQILGTRLGNYEMRLQSNYLSTTCIKLPVLLVGFGLIVLFEKADFTNTVINAIASTTFGIYLIHDYPDIRTRLWQSKYGLASMFTSPRAIPVYFAMIMLVFITCMLIDFIRQGLFNLTVNRHEGRWFDAFYHFIASRRWAQRLNKAVLEMPIPHETLVSGKDLLDQADNPIPPTDTR